MRVYIDFLLLLVYMVPFSRGNVRSHTLPADAGLDGKGQVVMLLSKGVHPLSPLVRAQQVLIPGGSPIVRW